MAKKKGKGKASEKSFTNEVAAELRAMRLTREKEVEVMSKLERERMEFARQKEERKREKEERKITMSNRNMLMTLMAKDHLSPEDEEMKRYLMGVVFKQ